MTPSSIRSTVVTERMAWIRQMVSLTKSLPLSTLDEFLKDSRNAGAAESYLRRGIEALLDIGRHILAKGFAVAASEYKEIGMKLAEHGVLSAENGLLMRRMAGYRNRMVHFYSEVSANELYVLCTRHLVDIETLCDEIANWLNDHPEKMDRRI